MRRQKSEKFFGQFMKKNVPTVIIPLFALLIIYFGFMSISALRTSPVLSTEISSETKQSIAYDYRVHTFPSLLFPRGSEPLPPGAKSYFTSIMQKIEFQVTGEIARQRAAETEGDLQVRIILRSPDQWEKELAFSPEITVHKPSDGVLQFQSSFTLPISEAVELGQAIEEELNVRPRDAYRLVIQSTLFDTSSAGDKPVEGFVGEYQFALRGNIIEPEGELFYEKIDTAKETVTALNYMTFWGYPLEVSMARILFPSVFIVFLLAGVIYYFHWRKGRLASQDSAALELERIRKRYGSRIIKAKWLNDIPEGNITVEMKNFKELVKIADERERPILQVDSKKNVNPDTISFYIIDEDALYLYKIAAGCRAKSDRDVPDFAR